MEKRIEKVEIDKLFGRFDYKIDLSEHQSSISILTAPNGYGKSTILKIISNFASGDYFYFARENFSSIRFHLSGHEIVEITHIDDDFVSRQVTIRCGNHQTKIKDPLSNQEGDERSFIIERTFPFLTRVGSKTWRHDRTGEVLDMAEILARYGDHPILRRNFKREEWLEKIRRSLNVFSIPTNRLKPNEDIDIRGQASTKNNLMASAIAAEIQEKMQTAIRTQFEEGRKKETNFPTRLMESLNQGMSPTTEAVNESIKSVQLDEKRYGRLGLLPRTGTTELLNKHTEWTEAGILVLKTYLDDIREKFSLFEDLAQRLDIFSSSVNDLIAFKEISTSADEGIVVRVTDGNKNTLPLSVLSSGEQHLIVLIGKLVFNTNQGSLVLIDEPEISFHPEWQEKFLSILEDIRKLNGFNVLVATHSPILIGDRWSSVIELAEQYQAAGDQLSLGV